MHHDEHFYIIIFPIFNLRLGQIFNIMSYRRKAYTLYFPHK